MIYGYARCSTNESKQDINRQLRELKAAGAEEVYFEYEHGDSAVKQKQLALFDIAAELSNNILKETFTKFYFNIDFSSRLRYNRYIDNDKTNFCERKELWIY